jgi:hypothetical protein
MALLETRDSIVWILINGYTRTEIDIIWDDLYPDLLEYKPEDLNLKKQGIADFLLAPRLVPFPAGVDIPDD